MKSRELYVEYSKAKDEMFLHTDTRQAPWYTVNSDNKKKARLNCIAHFLSKIPYTYKKEPPIKLPKLKRLSTMARP